MAMCVTAGAVLKCPFGLAPSTLMAVGTSLMQSAPAATIMDSKPFANIPPFGMCTSMANPIVASATAAAMGVLTPMPCIPSTGAPWMPGSRVLMIKGKPALLSNSKLICSFGGMITIISPKNMKVMSK